MIFYSFLGLVTFGVGWRIVRSPTFEALMRGKGADAGRFGSSLDHLADGGFGSSWNDDGQGGVRDSHIDSKYKRRPDQAP